MNLDKANITLTNFFTKNLSKKFINNLITKVNIWKRSLNILAETMTVENIVTKVATILNPIGKILTILDLINSGVGLAYIFIENGDLEQMDITIRKEFNSFINHVNNL
ncbi:hypothetical protein [Mycoplasmopsis verecunda]|uniref:Uncharacterized protein n=1 Tax=Mycoplasmopsis verecunda TaxID=171291 RepID=A0A1T4KYY8_9BACT|nr:hypothetical protein [Mycoplasmopsis verecunda]WPB54359.1 hypothetical protein SAM46_02615 [Mycoplasmopsis verecunda]SJZ47591.1 hypothetical protein SAMN02745154_00258 [Mycoplasmopsis verecunda]